MTERDTGATGEQYRASFGDDRERVNEWDDPRLADVPEDIRRLILQGTGAHDDPKKYASRSAALLAVCCELVRAGYDHTRIYDIITNRSWKISESVLKKGRGAYLYAWRQIDRA